MKLPTEAGMALVSGAGAVGEFEEEKDLWKKRC